MTDDTTTTTYAVRGMTCGHCAMSVREEVSELSGVEEVDVDLEQGRVTVRGDVSAEQVGQAVAEAGYEVVR